MLQDAIKKNIIKYHILLIKHSFIIINKQSRAIFKLNIHYIKYFLIKLFLTKKKLDQSHSLSSTFYIYINNNKKKKLNEEQCFA